MEVSEKDSQGSFPKIIFQDPERKEEKEHRECKGEICESEKIREGVQGENRKEESHPSTNQKRNRNKEESPEEKPGLFQSPFQEKERFSQENILEKFQKDRGGGTS